MRLPAPAKINLYLQVLGRRPDGYHELDSVMAKLSLADRVHIFLEPGPGPDLLRVENNLDQPLPDDFCGRGNLILKAVELYRKKTGWPSRRVVVELEKTIPLGAGLGGGSSDGAAVLTGLNRLSPQPLPGRDLAGLALSLGADVPFFIQTRPLARCRGIGDDISAPPPVFARWAGRKIFLVNPGLHLSTAEVFRNLGLASAPGENLGLTKQAVNNNLGPMSEPMAGQNDLFKAAVALAPDLIQLANSIKVLGPKVWGMSGSGSTFWFYDPQRPPDDLIQAGFWVRPVELAK